MNLTGIRLLDIQHHGISLASEVEYAAKEPVADPRSPVIKRTPTRGGMRRWSCMRLE